MGAGTEVYLALGANLGDRQAYLAAAVERVRERVSIEAASSIYETEPAYVVDQPRFLNAALRGRTALAPIELLSFLKRIERDIGRVAGPRFGPRAVDLDILVYGDQVLACEELTIPHPRMGERPFVLVPLAEIAPDLTPPGWRQTVRERMAEVSGAGDVIARLGPLVGESLNRGVR